MHKNSRKGRYNMIYEYDVFQIDVETYSAKLFSYL